MNLPLSSFRLFFFLFLIPSVLVDFVFARSTRPRPLLRIGRATDIRIDAASRQDQDLRARDNSYQAFASQYTGQPNRTLSSPHNANANANGFRLSFRAFSQDFYLHLQPNDHLIHPQGTTIRYYALNQTTGQSYVSKQETLYPESIRAYHGHVIHPVATTARLEQDRVGVQRDIYNNAEWGVVGRAAIVIHDDNSIEGSYDWLGNTHYLESAHNYASKRQQQDPALEARHLEKNHIIVTRDSDVMTEAQARDLGLHPASDSAAEKQDCSTDHLDFNSQSQLIRNNISKGPSSISRHSFFRKPPLSKRVRQHLGLVARSSSDIIGTPEQSTTKFPYDAEILGSYLLPRQATGDDFGNGDNQTSSYENAIGSTAGCPNSPRVVYMGVAADCTYTQRLGSQDNARREILKNINSVSNLYRSTFNISLGVVQLDVRSSSCPTTASSDVPWNVGCGGDTIDGRLSDFSQWRATQPANGEGLWHLMTACNSGTEIGVAWLGTLCMATSTGSGSQVVSGTAVSSITTQQWQVMAHEIGHNFGAIHDCSSGCSLRSDFVVQSGGATCCPLSRTTCDAREEFVMNPQSRPNVQRFSQCTVGNICSLLGQGLDTSCIQTPGQRATLSTQQCGNGILEPGEECDAGPSGSRCCTSQCKLAQGAQCDPDTSGCCTNSCTFAPSTQVCRPSVDDRCDMPEMCTGASAECPADVKKPDGQTCDNGLMCSNGHCTSRDLQCQQASTHSTTFSRACSAAASNTCQLTCQDPTSSNRCLILQQTFVDGTSCGYGGRCQGGECKTGSWQNTFSSWYTNNLRISIPVTIVVGAIALLLLWGLVRCCISPFLAKRRARSNRFMGKLTPSSSINTVSPIRPHGVNQASPPMPLPLPPPRRASVLQPSWVDSSAWNGPIPNSTSPNHYQR